MQPNSYLQNHVQTNKHIFDNPQTLGPMNKNDSKVVLVNGKFCHLEFFEYIQKQL